MRVKRLGARDVAWVFRSADLFDEPPDRQATASYLRDRANIFLLAVEDGRAVGFLRGTALRQVRTRRAQMFLYEIGVLPKYRRRGIGRSLIETLLRYCRRHGFEEVFVLTSPRNRAAVGLYRATGGTTETLADRMFVYRLRDRARAGE